MSYVTDIDELVFEDVIDGETGCRMFLEACQARGVRFSIPILELSHEDRQRVARAIRNEILARKNACDHV